MRNKREFMLFDGRARFDIADAMVVAFLDATEYRRAVAEARRDYEGFDYVLVSYRLEGDDLIDQQIHAEVVL